MKNPRTRARSEADATAPQKYPGFTDHGKFFWSDTYVDNAVTNWVRHMIDEIPKEKLSPAAVIRLLVSEPKWIQDCFSPYTLANWVRWERFSDWPFADAPSSFTRCLKDFGRGGPKWFRDPEKWSHGCDLSESRHGLSSRFDGIMTNRDELVGRLADKFDLDR